MPEHDSQTGCVWERQNTLLLSLISERILCYTNQQSVLVWCFGCSVFPVTAARACTPILRHAEWSNGTFEQYWVSKQLEWSRARWENTSKCTPSLPFWLEVAILGPSWPFLQIKKKCPPKPASLKTKKFGRHSHHEQHVLDILSDCYQIWALQYILPRWAMLNCKGFEFPSHHCRLSIKGRFW